MHQPQSLRVADAPLNEGEGRERVASRTREVESVAVRGRYADADDVDLSVYESAYSFPRFVGAVCDELGLDVDRVREVDAMPGTLDIDFGALLAFPDETLLFVGKDPTAKDAIPWFAFEIPPLSPMPAPETAQDALDLLKPLAVQDIATTEDWLPDRHGEWWLVPTNMMPAGDVVSPGVSSQPYGASPLGNHVPREYAFTATDEVFLRRFRDRCPDAPSSLATPEEVIQWTWRQQRKDPVPDWAPDWHDIRESADDVLVRGTIRHRDNDHFVEKLGEQWHRALTHDVEVYTGDEMAEDVHLDYHGG